MDTVMISYNEFRPKYDEQHQASIPVYIEPISDNPRWMTWALLAMFICSALLSGVHTVPTAYDTIDSNKVAEWVRQPVALGVFVFIELGIFFTSYSMFKKWSWIAFSILSFCILIAMGANLYSVYHALKTDDIGAQIVGIMFGLAAPFIAMMTGKQYVNFQRAEADAVIQARRSFQERKVRYDKNVEMAYTNYQQRIQSEIVRQNEIERERIRIEREQEQIRSLNSVNEQRTLSYSANSSTGYSKRMDAKSIIREYFTNHPDMLNAKLDELVVAIESEGNAKVGRTSVHNVRKELLEQSNRD